MRSRRRRILQKQRKSDYSSEGEIMRKQAATIKAKILIEIAEALLEGAAGPCDYWYRKLAERLTKRAERILAEET